MMWSLLKRLFNDIIRRAINIIYRNQYSSSSLPNNVILNCLARVPASYDPTLACVSSSSLPNDVVLKCLARVPTSYDPTLGCDSLLLSLPNDLVLNCLARVPTSHNPTLACVCKNFQSLVLSGELAQMRSLLAAMKDDPLLCVFYTHFTNPVWTFHWVTFNSKEKKTNSWKSVDISTTQNMATCPTVCLGSKIYFVGGSDYDDEGSFGLVIFDSRSGKLSKGPSMKVARKGAGVAVVDGKIYVIGGCWEDEINQVEVFDPNTQTWEFGPLGPHRKITYGRGYTWNDFRETVALDGKVYGMSFYRDYHTIYDTKDGTCENLELPEEYTWKIRKACVINSLIYVFYSELGLMWYDSEEKIWRKVKGLCCDAGRHMVECNGKLALLWKDSEEKIWCAMIALDRVGVEIHGRVEWSEIVVSGDVDTYDWCCLGLSL
ncbi:F-box/kelch-repeat protein [Raphanus sativus]|nr:F-box/kelch-repeat protein [Raphanus sativus]